MARVRQFAKDMGMSYNQANNLVKKGRKLKDGGSSVLESTMNQAKVIKADKGKITRIRKEKTGPAKVGQFKNLVQLKQKGVIGEKEMKAKIKDLIAAKKRGGTLKMKKGGFPDLSGDGKTTMKDILIGRGVIEKPQNKAGGGIPKMPKYRDGGAFRGCGAQVKGKKFKGIF